MTSSTAPSIAQLQIRAAIDHDWRARLVNDPVAALREAGADLPDDVIVSVVDQPAGQFILPIPPALDPEALDEDALAGVTGGTAPVLITTVEIPEAVVAAGDAAEDAYDVYEAWRDR